MKRVKIINEKTLLNGKCKNYKMTYMVKNYFKIAFRNLWKNKGFSAINIFFLAMGIAICLLITLFVKDELSYDKYNEKADRIYRVNADVRSTEQSLMTGFHLHH